MAKITFPDGSKRTVTQANEASAFTEYVAQSRAAGRQVDTTAESQAFNQLVGRDTAFYTPTDSGALVNINPTVQDAIDNPVFNASSSIFHSVPAGVQKIWSAASDFSIGAAHTAADKLASALGIGTVLAELLAVAAAGLGVFAIFFLVKHRKQVAEAVIKA